MASPRHVSPFGSQECRHFLSHPLLDDIQGLDVPRIVGIEHGRDDVFERVDDHAMGEQVILTALPDIIETPLVDLLHGREVDRHDMEISMTVDDRIKA